MMQLAESVRRYGGQRALAGTVRCIGTEANIGDQIAVGMCTEAAVSEVGEDPRVRPRIGPIVVHVFEDAVPVIVFSGVGA